MTASTLASPSITATPGEPLLTRANKAAAILQAVSAAKPKTVGVKPAPKVTPPVIASIFPTFASGIGQLKKAPHGLGLKSTLSVLGT
jgi:hypothetical protein